MITSYFEDYLLHFRFKCMDGADTDVGNILQVFGHIEAVDAINCMMHDCTPYPDSVM